MKNTKKKLKYERKKISINCSFDSYVKKKKFYNAQKQGKELITMIHYSIVYLMMDNREETKRWKSSGSLFQDKITIER